MKALKPILDDQMAEKWDFGQIGHQKDPGDPLVADIEYQKLVGKVSGNLS